MFDFSSRRRTGPFRTGLSSACRAALRRTGRDERGSISIETMVMLPVMFWALLFGFTVHDSYRKMSLHQKAAFSVGDAISRETAVIDDQYFTGMRDAFEYLSLSQGKTEMRLSQLTFDAVNNEYRTDWSEVRSDDVSPLTDGEVKNWHDKLPVMLDEERVILLETWSNHEPVFNLGLVEDEIRTFVFTRPRYAPKVCYNACT